MRQSLYDYCRLHQNQYLLDEWDTDKNLPFTPQSVAFGSNRKMWWRCAKGHGWQASIYTRSHGTGCPYCKGKAVLTGENDLASRYPELAKEWNEIKNAPLKPTDIVPQTHKRVWWKCAQGHEWRASVHSRAQGCGCPICANRVAAVSVNTLADRFPQIAEEWDSDKNAPITPEQVMPGTSRRFWWKCKAGHSYRSAVSSRTSGGSACPVCAGKAVQADENDLHTLYPEIAAQWDYEKNMGCTPDAVSVSSNRRVWWLCSKGHSYCAAVAARTRYKSECPYCTNKKVLPGFNDLATVKPLIAAQWDAELNGALTPQMVTPGSRQKVWWKCPVGHRWKAVVYSRTGAKAAGCPVCAGRTCGNNIKW